MNSRQKILLVHLYSNGDCLYATAIAKQIKLDFPGCHLTWAIAAFCKGILANNPYVDEVMEVNMVKDDVAAFRKIRKKMLSFKNQGLYDEVFITHLMDRNLAYYDGSIRSAILQAYQRPITVNIQPVLELLPQEKEKAGAFATKHRLQQYANVVLFEFAPQSKQLPITLDFALAIAKKLSAAPDTAIILSSADKIVSAFPNIIDGSELSLRETAYLTHYCTLLLGCSSGITWISTSSAAKQLPMVQLINPRGAWLNPVSTDFERFGYDTGSLIELTTIEETNIVECTRAALENFSLAKRRYHQLFPVHFTTTRKIVYNLLCYLQFGAILRHIQVNRKVYGDRASFYKEVWLGILTSPFILAKNFFTKRIIKNH